MHIHFRVASDHQVVVARNGINKEEEVGQFQCLEDLLVLVVEEVG